MTDDHSTQAMNSMYSPIQTNYKLTENWVNCNVPLKINYKLKPGLACTFYPMGKTSLVKLGKTVSFTRVKQSVLPMGKTG